MLFRSRAWAAAFGFGLIHGFGFASVMGESGLERGNMLVSLVGFNAGVEVGQLAVVLAFVPIAFLCRKRGFYQAGCVRFGSGAVIAVAAGWLAERVFDLKFMPF